MTDEFAFDLFSTSLVPVKSKKDSESARADAMQLESAWRMGDVPREQLPSIELPFETYFVGDGLYSFEVLRSWFRVSRVEYSRIWLDEATDLIEEFKEYWADYSFFSGVDWASTSWPPPIKTIVLVPVPHYKSATAVFNFEFQMFNKTQKIKVPKSPERQEIARAYDWKGA